jgi:hydroxypyruvate isomerase
MNDWKLWDRRTALKVLGAGAIGSLAVGRSRADDAAREIKGNIKQSICRWCYGQIPLDQLAAAAVKMGFKSIELITPEEYKTIKPYGLTCAMLGRVSITNGLNRTEFHEQIEGQLRGNIEFAAAEGLPNVICMAGNRRGMADDEGLKNCLIGLKRFIGLAEEKKVTVCMEGLNSKVDHKDYMYDKTAWGVELAKKLGSPRFKLLYDIYHMQIMEGDVIRTIRDNREYLAHFHTGGVPNRHEIDETQELYYPAVVRAILEKGYDGYLGQEFIPKNSSHALAALAQGFRICDV